jgi:large subunit ribosomal protein L24
MAKKFKKGDEIIVISGADKGKVGKILLVAEDRVVIEGVNVRTLHKKPTSSNPGQIVKSEKSIHISNIAHVEGGKAVKVKLVVEPGEGKSFKRKTRVSKKSGKKIGQ